MATAFSIVSGDIFESSLLGYLRGQARRIFFFFFRFSVGITVFMDVRFVL